MRMLVIKTSANAVNGRVEFMKIRNYLIILGIEYHIFSILSAVCVTVIILNRDFKFPTTYFLVGIVIMFLTGILPTLKVIRDYKEKYRWVKFLYILVFGIIFSVILAILVRVFWLIPELQMELDSKEFDLSLPENAKYLEYISEIYSREALEAYNLAILERFLITFNPAFPEGSEYMLTILNINFSMDDVNNAEYYNLIPFEAWDRFCEYFNEKVRMTDSVDKELHYFRNKLNRAPATLGELIKEKQNWELLSPSDTIISHVQYKCL
jgi:hypothetical protein